MVQKKRRKRYRLTPRFFLFILIIIVIILLGIFLIVSCSHNRENPITDPFQVGTSSTPGSSSQAELTPTPVPIPDPTSVASTHPDTFGLETEKENSFGRISTHLWHADLTFPDAESYTDMVGVTTFRGNNYRNDPTYGTAGTVSEKKLELAWTTEIRGSISKSGAGTWFGCGWTGQPLIVRWDEQTKNNMNIYSEKKAQQDLVEIIYATENSNIYFLDLKDGSFTRDKISGGWTFKGAGSLDPRGYPLLYVGAGDDGPNGAARNMIFSLIDGKMLYSYGASDPFAQRSFTAFDPASLIHTESDTLTYAAENGIVYQMKLNTNYDAQNGTISINPSDTVKMRYSTSRSRDGGTSSYWLGFESSPVIWRHYMYVSDNAGNLFCIDINTLEVVWMQDVMDDTNCSPVFEVDEKTGEASIYIGTSLHWTVDSNNYGYIPFWKINALTGEIVWKDQGYRCTRSSVSGGIQDTAALGKNNLSDLVYVAYAMTVDTETRGVLVAYNKANGEKVWVKELGSYSWSSPLIIYDDNGDGYIVECTSAGKMYLFDGRTGEKLDMLELEGNFEASPAAFGDTIVIGTRAEKIYGVKIK
ncbi:MAG: PQQ-like beta-propeller repeat protein [Clostridia bacterium]|nr:PQQ-like beta-propeller repeat protein [Clostridia bacterium]